MIEHADRRVWNIEGYEVIQLHIDYRFAFDCWWTKNDHLSVIIETPFTLRYGDCAIVCEPENVNSLKEALSILHKPVSTLTAFRDGRLLIIFADATELEVAKDPDYESWEAYGEGQLKDLRLLCTTHDGPPWAE